MFKKRSEDMFVCLAQLYQVLCPCGLKLGGPLSGVLRILLHFCWHSCRWGAGGSVWGQPSPQHWQGHWSFLFSNCCVPICVGWRLVSLSFIKSSLPGLTRFNSGSHTQWPEQIWAVIEALGLEHPCLCSPPQDIRGKCNSDVNAHEFPFAER